jgi:Flp pilus assembly protein TadD
MATQTPANSQSLTLIAAQHMQAGRLHEAEAIYRDLLTEHPAHHEALFKMGMLLNLQGNFDGAIDYFRKVLALTPDMVEAHLNLGNVCYQKKDYAEALTCLQQALQLRPRSVESHNNLGNVLKELGKFDEALANYKKALTLKPGSAIIFNNIGETYRGMDRIDEAVAHFRKALAVKPDFAHAQWNLSMIFLRAGDFAAGLSLYEKRFDAELLRELGAANVGVIAEKISVKPRWKGGDLQGKTLVVWTEQGFGDSIMMMRYLPLLKQMGAGSVIVYCHPKLTKMMLTAASLVVDHNTPLSLDSFDAQCPIMSLPLAFGTTLESIPQTIPYLNAPAAESAKWAAQLGKFNGLKVGLAWAGGKDFPHDAMRSIALQRFAPMLALPGVQYVSLQKDEAAQQLNNKNWRVLDWMGDCDDFMDTAALISGLDIVITVDTAIAHLAGAMGKPVWLLNRTAGDWRWMSDREDSPWYPGMRIFRQKVARDWDSVIEAVTDELGKQIPAGQPGPLDLSEQEWQKIVAATNQATATGKKKGIFSRLFG